MRGALRADFHHRDADGQRRLARAHGSAHAAYAALCACYAPLLRCTHARCCLTCYRCYPPPAFYLLLLPGLPPPRTAHLSTPLPAARLALCCLRTHARTTTTTRLLFAGATLRFCAGCRFAAATAAALPSAGRPGGRRVRWCLPWAGCLPSTCFLPSPPDNLFSCTCLLLMVWPSHCKTTIFSSSRFPILGVFWFWCGLCSSNALPPTIPTCQPLPAFSMPSFLLLGVSPHIAPCFYKNR